MGGHAAGGQAMNAHDDDPDDLGNPTLPELGEPRRIPPHVHAAVVRALADALVAYIEQHGYDDGPIPHADVVPHKQPSRGRRGRRKAVNS